MASHFTINLANIQMLLSQQQSGTNDSIIPESSHQGMTTGVVTDVDGVMMGGDKIVTQEGYSLIMMLFLGIILGGMIIFTIIGNVFVVMAILRERQLQTVANYLVLSLAVADLLVACVVMPPAAVAQVCQQWPLGALWCDIWTCCDVLCCTASILHLLAIAWHRYRTVTSVQYLRGGQGGGLSQIRSCILLVWGVSLMISLAPPILGWKDEDFQRRIEEDRQCIVSQHVSYQIFATGSSFYVPLIVTLSLYWKIYQVARKRIRRKPGQLPAGKAKSNLKPPLPVTLTSCNSAATSVQPSGGSANSQPEPVLSNDGSDEKSNEIEVAIIHSPPKAVSCYDQKHENLALGTDPSDTCLSPANISVNNMADTSSAEGSCSESSKESQASRRMENNISHNDEYNCNNTKDYSGKLSAYKAKVAPISWPVSQNAYNCTDDCEKNNSQILLNPAKFLSNEANHNNLQQQLQDSLHQENEDKAIHNNVDCEEGLNAEVNCEAGDNNDEIHEVVIEDGGRRGETNEENKSTLPCTGTDQVSTPTTTTTSATMITTTCKENNMIVKSNVRAGNQHTIAKRVKEREKAKKRAEKENDSSAGKTGEKAGKADRGRLMSWKESLEAKRERKAGKTLAIITGIFVICWLPFFVTVLVMALCAHWKSTGCYIPSELFDFFLWLGYANSMINPIIYTLFSPDFRTAFKKILAGGRRTGAWGNPPPSSTCSWFKR